MHKEMKDYGMIRVAAAVPRVKVADVAYNFEGICRMVDEAEAKDRVEEMKEIVSEEGDSVE